MTGRTPFGQPRWQRPTPSDFATKEDLRFTRFMPSASTSISSDMEFIELANQGQDLAVLNGWTFRTTTGPPAPTTPPSPTR